METAVTPPAEADLHLLTDWSEPGRRRRIGRSAVLSLVLHVLAIVFVLAMPETFMQPARPREQATLVTQLTLPPLSLTQTAPNEHKIVRDVRSADLTPRSRPPAGPSPDPEAAAPRKPVPSPPPPPKATPNPLPEPPKLEIAVNENPKLTLPVQIPQPPQPTKPAFEDVPQINPVPPGQRAVDIGGPSVENAIRGAMAGKGQIGQGAAPIASSGAELPQLLSDPMGVDWTPYLVQVRESVRRYWLSILPKSGRRAYVSVQFAIRRDGSVGKVAYAQSSGDNSLDHISIAAISGGGPLGRYRPSTAALRSTYR